jgi:hypothetical protein
MKVLMWRLPCLLSIARPAGERNFAGSAYMGFGWRPKSEITVDRLQPVFFLHLFSEPVEISVKSLQLFQISRASVRMRTNICTLKFLLFINYRTPEGLTLSFAFHKISTSQNIYIVFRTILVLALDGKVMLW